MVTLADADPGCAQQDRRDGVGGVYDGERADQQRERLGRLHAEGDRQQDGHRTGAAEAGDEADDETGEDADEQQEQRWVRPAIAAPPVRIRA